ncbi:hypothetical protein D9613_008868 [Agrocybe pediades]|uniref:F-box domain-containing protein n=1 Tax=Agrocybe pediades TaxID=84607 RepID=A0A8H4QTF9_9AGAR|nr:hypothetical protein D9613_008868 [Agrocybe pediades]
MELTIPLSQDETCSRTRRDIENINCGTTRLPPNLPVELHKLIVDELEGEKKTLKQCALTCRVYRHLAQKLLFKSVMPRHRDPMWDYHDTHNVDIFLDILRESPQIANYVHRLHLFSHPLGIGIQSDDSPSKFLSALTNVVDLVLGWKEMTCYFLKTPPATQLAVMNKCQSILSLTARFLSDMPLKLFDHLQRLETLTLEKVTFTDDPGMQILQNPPSQIKHMTLGAVMIEDVGTIFPFLVKQEIGMGKLESLTIDLAQSLRMLSPPDIVAVKSFIRGSAKSLKVLRITASWYVPAILGDDEPLFEVSEMLLLEELSLSGVAYCDSWVSWGWMSRLLETIPVNRRFKRITLLPNLANNLDLVTEDEEDDDPEGFKYLEKVIVDKVLPHTESFSIDFRIWEMVDDETETSTEEEIQKSLPILHALNLLHFL